jgi:hypothetical protein
MSVFLVATFVPWTMQTLTQHGIDTLSGSAGHASYSRQQALQR